MMLIETMRCRPFGAVPMVWRRPQPKALTLVLSMNRRARARDRRAVDAHVESGLDGGGRSPSLDHERDVGARLVGP